MTYEARLVARSSADGASANLANRGGRGRGRGQYQEQQHQYRDQRSDYNQRNYERSYDQRNNRDGYGGGRGNGGRNQHGGRTNAGRSNDICQVCGKEGHIALNCWKRFRKGYMGPDKSAGAAYGGSYGVDTNWYSDSGATDHVTSELEKLQVRDRYNGNE
jgi:hypothetical protein